MANALLQDLSAAAALSGSDLFYVKQGGARGLKATGTQLLALVGTAYVPLAGGTMTGPLTIASGTLTASAPALNITQTLNNAGVAFSSMVINATVTAASGASKLLQLQLGGSSKFDFYHNGLALPGSDSDITFSQAGSLRWSSNTAGSQSADLYLYRDAAATLAQRNGATAQTLRIYGTADGSPGSNYQRMVLSANGTTGVTIAAEGLGTPGANQNITLKAGGTGSITFNLNGSDSAYFDYIGNLVLKSLYSTSLYLPSTALSGWTSGSLGASIDIALMRNAAGVVEVTNGTANTYRDLKLRNLIQTEYSQLTEMTAPAAPATNSVRIYAEDNGAGKTRLMALFATGAAQQISIEP